MVPVAPPMARVCANFKNKVFEVVLGYLYNLCVYDRLWLSLANQYPQYGAQVFWFFSLQ